MADAVTSFIEAAVGAACLVASAGAWRRPGLRALAAFLAVAGTVALVRAIAALV